MAVRPELQGQGIGLHLLERVDTSAAVVDARFALAVVGTAIVDELPGLAVLHGAHGSQAARLRSVRTRGCEEGNGPECDEFAQNARTERDAAAVEIAR